MATKIQKHKDRIIRYQSAFSTPDGLWVLNDMRKHFERFSYVPRKSMTFDEVAYNEGIRSVYNFIVSTMDASQIERLNKIQENDNE